MGRLVAIYDLRLADAHLPSNKVNDALKLLDIDDSIPTIHQGYQMMRSCVDSIYYIIDILNKW
jgi:hypothetical protein